MFSGSTGVKLVAVASYVNAVTRSRHQELGLVVVPGNIGEPDVGVLAGGMFVAEKGRRMYRQCVCDGSVMVCLLGKSAGGSGGCGRVRLWFCVVCAREPGPVEFLLALTGSDVPGRGVVVSEHVNWGRSGSMVVTSVRAYRLASFVWEPRASCTSVCFSPSTQTPTRSSRSNVRPFSQRGSHSWESVNCPKTSCTPDATRARWAVVLSWPRRANLALMCAVNNFTAISCADGFWIRRIDA
jgi:hypothetical protein